MDSHTQTGRIELDDVTTKNSFFRNPDLMAMTFSHFRNVDEKRQDLLNAALTCKDFLDEALNVLWEEMDSLLPLLKMLPALQVKDGAYVCALVNYPFLST